MSRTEEKKSEKLKPTLAELFLQLIALPEIEKVEKMASLFFSLADIAVFLGYDIDEFRSEIRFKPTTDRAIAYHKGTISTQIKLRLETLDFAIKGSSKAEETMLDYLARQKETENG